MEKQTYTETEDTITYEGDLILEADLKISKNLVVKGRIFRKDNNRYDILARNIDAWNIDAWNIHAWNIHTKNIHAWNIHTKNIDAWNIHAWNIDAWNIIFCDKIKVKEGCKIICKVLIKDRFILKKKEQEA